MKALSVKQPFADLILLGKTIETRTWATSYRGDILICASQKYHMGSVLVEGHERSAKEILKRSRLWPTGVMICVANLVDCRPMIVEDERAAMCRYYDGAYAWVLDNIRPVQICPVKGQLGLFDVNDLMINYL